MKNTGVIYIDHNIISPGGELKIFIDAVKARISRVNSSLKILSYEDIHNDSHPIGDEEGQKLMLEDASKAIDSAFVTIAILDSSYLDYLKQSPALIKSINQIINEDDRYFFPIIYSKTNWLSEKWLVPLTIYPQFDTVLDLTKEQRTQLINLIGERVEEIVNLPKQDKFVSSFTNDVSIAVTKAVFISHSHDDSDFAELLQLKFRESGIESWIDNQRLKIGQNWREEIDRAIDESLALIVVMSPEARKSEYVTYEWAYAWGRGKPIFPVMLKQTSLHPRLESLQYLNFTLKQSRPYKSLFESIDKLKNKT